MARKKKQNWKNRDGVVYSTDDSYQYDEFGQEDAETLPPSQQILKMRFEKRKGKAVTLIEGFIGSADDLKDLGRELRNFCGVGGSAKDEVILLQGDFRPKVREYLERQGYRVKG